ncbi:MAG: T9SS type A sorting domain-containing protein, partial [Bacteroidota bacterium]|nr:T9SS type A sorting domain-containing protein [Bacteroidota bacterium]
ADFTVNKTIQCDRGNEFIFTDVSNAGSNYSLSWDFDNGSFGSNPIESQSFVYGVKNYFDIKLTIDANACKDSVVKRIFLIGNPSSNSISGLIDVKLFDTASYHVPFTPGSIYRWQINKGVGYSLTHNFLVKFTQLGEDTIRLVEQNSGGCLSDTMKLAINIRSGVGLVNWQEEAIQLFPNPVNNVLYLSNLPPNAQKISLLDVMGKVVLVRTNTDDNTQIDCSFLANGIYFLHLANDLGKVSVTKLVVQH